MIHIGQLQTNRAHQRQNQLAVPVMDGMISCSGDD
jgi:hypothetical protein